MAVEFRIYTRPDNHQLLEQWFKSYDAICADGGHLAFFAEWDY